VRLTSQCTHNRKESLPMICIRSIVSRLFFLVLIVLQCNPAVAATFVGVRTVGSYSADITIETDGTLGTLVRSNILDWTVIITAPSGVATLFGDKSPFQNSGFLLDGPLVAYSDRLDYLEGSVGSLYIFYNANVAGVQGYYYCIQINGCFDFEGPGEAVEVGGIRNVVRRTGVITFGAEQITAVPEPESWLLMLAGFGIVGAALRLSSRRSRIMSQGLA
jgi:hypothetical protein